MSLPLGWQLEKLDLSQLVSINGNWNGKEIVKGLFTWDKRLCYNGGLATRWNGNTCKPVHGDLSENTMHNLQLLTRSLLTPSEMQTDAGPVSDTSTKLPFQERNLAAWWRCLQTALPTGLIWVPDNCMDWRMCLTLFFDGIYPIFQPFLFFQFPLLYFPCWMQATACVLAVWLWTCLLQDYNPV